ncbi:octopamine receptor 2 [Aedes albopictus]|uniref:G-protein coupled receptors family 1 profile domain-containing protein n=1 Tax=Aedes albopictus TaxID=7160 RepID=A0ABM1Y7B8_AEDAL|nr:octopamine receptor 2-like [Aedes albopictus]
MTESSFVYGVELRSPPPTTGPNSQLTQYDRFLKTKTMTEHLLLGHHYHYEDGPTQLPFNMAELSSLLAGDGENVYTTSHIAATTTTNLTSSLGQIRNIMAELSLRSGSSAVVTVATTTTGANSTPTEGSSPIATSAGSRGGGGDSTFQNNLIIPLYAVIFLFSVVGNLLVILTLAQNKRMRTVTNVYLLNLAISDLLLGVFCMPFTLVGQVLRKFIFGSLMCKLIPYFQAVSVSVAVWTLVAISLERYFAICRPLSSRRWQTQFHAYKMIALVWLVSFLVNSPLCYIQRLQPVHRLRSATSTANGLSNVIAIGTDSTQPMKCREMWPDKSYERAYVLFLDAGLLCFPLITMGFSYSMIVSKLWRGLRREIRHSTHQKHQLQITNATSISLDALSTNKILPSRAQDNSYYLLSSSPSTAGSAPTTSTKRTPVNSGGPSFNNNNNYFCSSYGTAANNGLHYGRGPPDTSGGSTSTAGKQRCRTRFGMLKHFMESRRPKCNTNPIITLNSATQFIAPAGTGSSVNNSAGCGNKLYSFMPPPSSATPLATPMSETAFHDCRITAPTVASSCNGQPPKGATDALSTASTMAMVGAPLTSSDPSVLSIPATPSFTRHAIRSNYMDKSIEAKKKVIRMLFVIIVEFFVCWAPLHILNTVYLYSPAFVYQYVSSNGIALVQLMAYISSCCNPITYCFMNRRFRQAFLNIFGCYRHRIFLCLCCCFRCGADDDQMDGESKSAGSRANPNNTGGAGTGANNSDISGNDSLAYAGRSIVQRSEIMVLESEDRV